MSVLPAISFPVPSNGQGKAFNSQEEILSHLDGENSGPYLVGTQGMWHGGIHITDLTTPWCALSGNNSSEVQYVAGNPCKGEQSVRCMADGEIIAYRVCKDYESVQWHGSPLFFSGSFVLVRHYVQPGEKKESGLTFFTLYMNTAPFSVYRQGDENERVTASALTYYASAEDVIAGKKAGSLPAGSHVTLGNEVISASRNQQNRQYSEVTLVNVPEGSPLASGTVVWIVSDRNNLKLASGTADTPSWWTNCTPAYSPAGSSLTRYRTAKNWRYYLSRDDVLANHSAGTLQAGFPVSADLSNTAFQVIRSSDSHTFSLVTLGQVAGREAKGNRVWMVSDGDSLTAENESTSDGQPVFDRVVSLSTPLKIMAGDSIGHLGFFELPTDNGKLSRYQVHIECLSTDENLENFLTNPEKVGEDDPVCLKYDKDVPLMMPDAKGVMVDAQRKTRAPGVVEMSQVTGVDRDGHSVTDKKRAAYYEIEPEAGWLAAEKAAKISRYAFAALGFTTLKSTTDNFDLIDGIHHPAGVVKSILEQLYAAAQAETRSEYALNAFNYRRLLEQVDSNRDGYYSEEEYVQAIHNPSYRNQLFRLIVKHPGEWYYSKGDAPWKNYLDSLGEDAQAWRDYTEAFLDKIVWMKQVPEMVAEPWHMHPLMFMGALNYSQYDFSTRNGVIHAIVAECKRQGLVLNTQIAYVLATVKRETGDTFQPVKEGDWQGHIVTDVYRREHYRYYPYYGRGYVQITWEHNYKTYSDKLNTDMVADPELALEPNNALFILVDGFKNGVFTGHSISDYVNEATTDFFNARRCINGLDHAAQIKGFAEEYLSQLNNGELS
ncbi:hypothetical protein [Cronobacter turicensis]|uniref:hypothetical protein n=1 Tax=Cronobacter turicensis TaxID=413502 RepID=UPI0024C33F8A|nr:hypothetical protein [Cronobacter turicensis]MDK1229592.1 hypothetical protein [Cronobacter turicensis]